MFTSAAYLLLPILALIPNFFIPPPLGYPGLATQEMVFSVAAAVLAMAGAVLALRAGGLMLEVDRLKLLALISLGAFIAWQAASLAWAPSPYDGLSIMRLWLCFGIFIGVGFFVIDARTASALSNLLNLIIVVLVASLLYERYLFGANMFGVFFNHGISSELLALLIPMPLLRYLCSGQSRTALVSFVVAGLGIVGILIDLRRGAILGLVVSIALIALALLLGWIRIRNRKRLLIILALALVAASIVGIRFRSEVIYRIEGATRLESSEGGLTTRLRGWITAWEMFKRNPVIGVGNAGYASLYGEYRKFFVSDPNYSEVARSAGAEDNDEIRSPLVHNEYLQIAVELGIVGLLLFAAACATGGRLLLRGLRSPNNYHAFGPIAGLVAFGVSSFTSGFSFRCSPGIFMTACVVVIGVAFGDGGDEERRVEAVSIPRRAATALIAVITVCALALSVRTFYVYSSQKLQGQDSLSQEPLDFAIVPENPAANQRFENRYLQVIELDPGNSGAHLGYGLLLFQLKRPQEAIRHVEYAWKNGYSRPLSYVLLAFCHEQSGNPAEAAAILGRAVDSYPQSIFVRIVYADILGRLGNIDEQKRQRDAAYAINERVARSWELICRMKPREASLEAASRDLIPPEKLEPLLARTLVLMRSYIYH